MSKVRHAAGRSRSSIQNLLALGLVLLVVVAVALGATFGRLSVGATLGPGTVLVLGLVLYLVTGGRDRGEG